MKVVWDSICGICKSVSKQIYVAQLYIKYGTTLSLIIFLAN